MAQCCRTGIVLLVLLAALIACDCMPHEAAAEPASHNLMRSHGRRHRMRPAHQSELQGGAMLVTPQQLQDLEKQLQELLPTQSAAPTRDPVDKQQPTQQVPPAEPQPLPPKQQEQAAPQPQQLQEKPVMQEQRAPPMPQPQREQQPQLSEQQPQPETQQQVSPPPPPPQQQQQQPAQVAQPPAPQVAQPQPLLQQQPQPATQSQEQPPQKQPVQPQQPQQQQQTTSQPRVQDAPAVAQEQQKQLLNDLKQPKPLPQPLPQQAPLEPLLPSCVPKYALDLVIPPPMPVSATTFTQSRRASTSSTVKAARGSRAAVASVQSTGAAGVAGWRSVVASEGEFVHPAHVGIASLHATNTAEKIIKLRQQLAVSEESYDGASGASDAAAAEPGFDEAVEQQQEQQQAKGDEPKAESDEYEEVDGEQLELEPAPKQSEEWWYDAGGAGGAGGAAPNQQQGVNKDATKNGGSSREEALKRLQEEVRLHEENIRLLELELQQRLQKKAKLRAQADTGAVDAVQASPQPQAVPAPGNSSSNGSSKDAAAAPAVNASPKAPAPSAAVPLAPQPQVVEQKKEQQPQQEQPKPQPQKEPQPAQQKQGQPEQPPQNEQQQPQEQHAAASQPEQQPKPEPQQPQQQQSMPPKPEQPKVLQTPSEPATQPASKSNNTTQSQPEKQAADTVSSPAAAAPQPPRTNKKTKQVVAPPGEVFDSYDVSVRQVQQTVLPPTALPGPQCPAALGETTVYGYGPANVADQPFHSWPGFTIEAQRHVPTRVRWVNGLMDAAGNFLPHILRDAIDQTVTWANPQATGGSTDSSPCKACAAATPFACAADPACVKASTSTYTGPVPVVTHVQGQQNVPDWADGYPEAWFTPDAANLAGFSPVGSWYNTFQARYTAATNQPWAPGSNTAVYDNTQRPAALWYHDQTLGLSRTNVYAGLSGLYFIRERFPSIANGPELPGLPYPAYDGVVAVSAVRELPLAIQDRAFTTDGQLWYPTAAHAPGSFLPNGPLHPRWLPGLFADVLDPADPRGKATINMLMMTVNGRTYPRHVVYPDSYRLRLLNGCNSRTLHLRFARSPSAALVDPLAAAETVNLLPFWVVGSDGGFWPQLQPDATGLLMAPGERYDVVVDFSRVSPGEFVFLLNNGPETGAGLFDGTNLGEGLTEHTAQVMRFDVHPLPTGQTAKPFDLAQQLLLNNALAAAWAANEPGAPLLQPGVQPTTQVSIQERVDPDNTALALLLGGVTAQAVGGLNTATPQLWSDPVSTSTATDSRAVWDIINLSEAAQTVTLHSTDFEFLGRYALLVDPVDPAVFTKTATPVASPDLDSLLTLACAVSTANPTGHCGARKDTMLVLPGSYTRIAFKAPATAGLFGWHSSLLESKDNEGAVPHCFGSSVAYLHPKTGLIMCPALPAKGPAN